MKIYQRIDQIVGKTPLLRANNIEKELGLDCAILLKLEFFNPAGSIKDRVAKAMLKQAEKDGLLKKGGTVIEPTSGNTGIGLACLCSALGYNAIFTMPETMSVERRKLLTAYGAKVVLTDGSKGMQGAIDKAEEIQKNTPNSIICGQFENQANPKSHYDTTAVEIWEDTDGKIDYLVAGIGTGGTISGTARYLKEKNADIKVIGVEPASSPLITKGKAGKHNLQGIGANFIPQNYDASVVDEVTAITEEEAYDCVKLLARKEGVLAGISSGASLSSAIKLAKTLKDKTIVVILPDTGSRYMSTDVFD